MAALASRGLKGKILLMEKFSEAKADALQLLGAEVIRVPNHLNDQVRARELAELEGAYHFGQFYNILNPQIHETTTAEEIWAQCGGKIDAVVAGCGTGGTLMGLSRSLKKKNPKLKVVGVSPVGAKLLPQDDVGCWEIEGIGTPYSPPLCDLDLVDEWVRVNDKESFQTAHRMMVENSILCGSSAGANMAGALRSRIVTGLSREDRCVVILPDSSKNYPNTLSNYEWMKQKGYLYTPSRKGNDRQS
jgi:cystathionine beta-synthase